MTRWSLMVVGALHFLPTLHAEAQRIPRDEYLRNIPLRIPTMIRQTAASEELDLFGSPTDPGYRNVEPVDGIDDRRGVSDWAMRSDKEIFVVGSRIETRAQVGGYLILAVNDVYLDRPTCDPDAFATRQPGTFFRDNIGFFSARISVR